MNVKQETKANLYFYGYSIVTKKGQADVTTFWEIVQRDGRLAKLFMQTQSLTAVGIVDKWQTDGQFRYQLGVIVSEPNRELEKIAPMSLSISPQTWNVLREQGDCWHTIYQLWRYYEKQFGQQYPQLLIENYQFESIKSKCCHCELWW